MHIIKKIKLSFDNIFNKLNYFKWKWLKNLLDVNHYPSFFWLLKVRFRHIILTLTVTHGTALVSIFISFLLTIILLYLQNGLGLIRIDWLREIAVPELMAIIIFWVIIFLFVVTSLNYFLFKKTPPKNYANITVGGASFSDAIRLLSYETWKICLCYQHKINNSRLVKIAEEIKQSSVGQTSESSLYDITEKDKELIYRSLKLMKSFENRQQRYLQNIIQLKVLISEQYLISQRSLCDYIIQFSPSIYEELFRKYRSIWNEVNHISALNPRDRPELQQRFYSLANAALRVHNSIIEIIGYQIQLIEFTSLHNFIHSIAYDLSTSSSLKNYIEALSEIADNGDKKAREQLKFMYIKRNAHSGFDLHKAAINFCDQYNDEKVKKIKEILLKIRDAKTNDLNTIASNEISPLKEFFVLFHRKIVAARNKIVKNFVIKYDTDIVSNAKSKDTLLIIHGYSKTVRQMIKKGFQELKKSDNDFEPKVFLLNSSKEGEEMLNTRLMRVELKSDKSYSDFKKNTFSGDESYLLSLLKPGLQVVLFLGAECFDMNGENVGRSMHINGISDRIEYLRNKINKITEKEFKVILAAESYKKYDDLLNIREFYKDRLEPIDVYLPGMIDLLITDN